MDANTINLICEYATLAITVIFVLIGFFSGLIKGWRRAFVRLITVIIAAVAAYFTKDYILNLILNIDINGVTLEKTLISLIPSQFSSAATFALNLVKGLGLAVIFVVAFIVLKIVSRILYWIINAFVARKSQIEGHKKHLFGGLIGAVQGALVSCCIMIPVMGVVGTVSPVIQDEDLISLADQYNIEDYLGYANKFINAPVSKFYSDTCKPVFTLITSTTDSNGNKIVLADNMEALTSVVKMATKLASAVDDLNNIDFSTGDVSSITTLLNELGDIQGEMSPESKKIVSDIIKSSAESLGKQYGLDTDVLESLDMENVNFKTEAAAMDKLAELEKTDSTLTPAQVKETVKAFADSTMVYALVKSSEADVKLTDEADKIAAKEAIDEGNYSDEKKAELYTMLGLSEQA